MRGTFSVKNFERFQHYKGRTPPWIKLYNNLLDDYDFSRLPDGAKWHLVGIFLLASRYDNKIPADLDWLAKKLSATIVINLPLLEQAGFIVFDQACSKVLAPRKQSDLLEIEEETEIDQRKKDSSAGPSKKGPAQEGLALEPIVISIPTNRFDTIQEEVGYTQSKIDQWQATYPGVDVPKMLAVIRQWSIDADAQRKTAKGMNKFINAWLAREQNRGGNRNEQQQRPANPSHGGARNSRLLQGIGAALAAESE